MAVYQWLSGTGNWNNAADWVTYVNNVAVHRVPRAGDTAQILGGYVTINSAIAAGEIDVETDAYVYLGADLTYSGVYSVSGGAELFLRGHTLTLSGTSNVLGGFITGKGTLKVTGAAVVDDSFGCLVRGGATIEDDGAITQEGTLDLHEENWGWGELLIDSGATYTVATKNADIFDANVVNDGTLTIDANDTLSLYGVLGTDTLGSIIGTGMLSFIDSKVTLTDSELTVGAIKVSDGSYMNIGGDLTYAGVFSNLAGGELKLDGHTLTLSGASNTLDYTIQGKGTVKVTGAAIVAASSDGDGICNVGGGATLEDAGAMTQQGSLYLDDTGGKELLIDAGATYTITTSNADIEGHIVNHGTLTIDAADTLSLDDPDNALGGSVDGAGTLNLFSGGQIVGNFAVAATDFGDQLTVDSSVASSQTLYFKGLGAELVLGDISVGGKSQFHGSISGFGSQDGFDDVFEALGFGTGTTFGFSENKGGASGTLTLIDGTETAAIKFLGDYTKADFNAKVGATSTVFTFS